MAEEQAAPPSSSGSDTCAAGPAPPSDAPPAGVLPVGYNVRSASGYAESPPPETGDPRFRVQTPLKFLSDAEAFGTPTPSGTAAAPPPSPETRPGPAAPSHEEVVARAVPALLDDPLREVTRKERRSLLGVSVIAILVSWTGLVPEKIENLGITFAATERRALLFVFLGVVVYYAVAFGIYAWADYLNHSNKVYEANNALREARWNARAPTRVASDPWQLIGQVDPISRARIAFEGRGFNY